MRKYFWIIRLLLFIQYQTFSQNINKRETVEIKSNDFLIFGYAIPVHRDTIDEFGVFISKIPDTLKPKPIYRYDSLGGELKVERLPPVIYLKKVKKYLLNISEIGEPNSPIILKIKSSNEKIIFWKKFLDTTMEKVEHLFLTVWLEL